MNKIHVLDNNLIDKIAAGEVVERPASVVKELMENAIDAGSTSVTVEIQEGGIRLISISDNGKGIPAEQVPTAFLRHATSKLNTFEDLGSVLTLGFRGEALSSIASVAQVEMVTKTADSDEGTKIAFEGGRLIENEPCPGKNGTTIVVRNLFYNTPARRKFLKKPSTEAGYVSEAVNRIALGHPQVAIKYINNGNIILQTAGKGDLKTAALQIYGRDHTDKLIEVKGSQKGYSLKGFVARPELSRANRSYESFFINGRFVKSKLVSDAVEEAYKGRLMGGKFPVFVLNLTVPENTVDVNVHPTKLEVRFSEEELVYDLVLSAVTAALKGEELIPQVSLENKRQEKKTEQIILDTDIKRADTEEKSDMAVKMADTGVKNDVAVKMADIKEKSDSAVKKVETEEKSDTAVKTADTEEKPDTDTKRADTEEKPHDSRLDEILGRIPDTKISFCEDFTDEERKSFSEIVERAVKREGLENIKPSQESSRGEQSSPAEISANSGGEQSSPAETSANSGGEQSSPAETSANSRSEQCSPAESPTNPAGESSGDDRCSSAKNPAEDNSLIWSPQGEKPQKKSFFTHYKIVGQLFDTYWIVEQGDKMYMIDQHAAHERVLYERLKEKMEKGEAISQLLLQPIAVRLTQSEKNVVNENAELLESFGYDIEELGPDACALRAVPFVFDKPSGASFFLDIIDTLRDKTIKSIYETKADALATMSCKAAVKGSNALSYTEAKALIEAMLKLENPFNCPHGRPTIVEMTKYQVEKMFKRTGI